MKYLAEGCWWWVALIATTQCLSSFCCCCSKNTAIAAAPWVVKCVCASTAAIAVVPCRGASGWPRAGVSAGDRPRLDMMATLCSYMQQLAVIPLPSCKKSLIRFDTPHQPCHSWHDLHLQLNPKQHYSQTQSLTSPLRQDFQSKHTAPERLCPAPLRPGNS